MDLFVAPVWIFIIISYSIRIRNKRIKANPSYKYYVNGIGVKIIGAVCACFVFALWYRGGDTIGYYEQAVAISRLLFKNPAEYFDILFGGCNATNVDYFDDGTGWMPAGVCVQCYPEVFLSRLIAPLCLLSFNSFVSMTILLSWIGYSGIWKLYLLFCEKFPEIRRNLAISILFIPSVVFWGSCLLKDTVTIAALGWFTFTFYELFFKRNYKLINFIVIFVSTYLLIAIKPYIFFAILPGSLIWASYHRISIIRNKLIKFIVTPLFLFTGAYLGYFLITSFGGVLGDYSLDKIFYKAVLTQSDLASDHYGGHNFNIGTFDPSISGVLSKADVAITAALFRPFIWEVGNAMMLLSGLENSYILFLTIGLIIRLKVFGFFRFIGSDPLLLFSMLFSIFFAFSVGLTTANFGALVRLKIPCIPFYVSSLFILRHLYEKKYKRKLGF